MPSIRVFGPGDAALLDHVAKGIIDNAVDPGWMIESLTDSRHHLAVGHILASRSLIENG